MFQRDPPATEDCSGSGNGQANKSRKTLWHRATPRPSRQASRSPAIRRSTPTAEDFPQYQTHPFRPSIDFARKTLVTHQFRVSGLIVFNLFLCFCQVLQLAFSNLTPLAISCLCLVIDLHEAQTSSSDQSWER